MSIFEDLTPYTYDRNNEGGKALNVGWLGQGFSIVDGDFPTGDVPLAAIAVLDALPVTNLYRGWHTCEFCSLGISGNGDKRVQGRDGVVYIAPVLITHYIATHRYLPPQDFIDALLAQ